MNPECSIVDKNSCELVDNKDKSEESNPDNQNKSEESNPDDGNKSEENKSRKIKLLNNENKCEKYNHVINNGNPALCI